MNLLQRKIAPKTGGTTLTIISLDYESQSYEPGEIQRQASTARKAPKRQQSDLVDPVLPACIVCVHNSLSIFAEIVNVDVSDNYASVGS